MLEETKSCAKQKFQCLVKEIELDGENLTVTVIDISFLQAKFLSPAPTGTVTEEAGSLQGS